MISLTAMAYVAAMLLAAIGISLRSDPAVVRRLTVMREVRARRGPIAALGRRVRQPGLRRGVGSRVAAAGLPSDALDRVIGAKVLLLMAGAVIGLNAAPAPLGALLAGSLAAGGFVLPDFVLARRARSIRARSMAAAPDLLDAVAVCVGSGLAPRMAMEHAAGVVQGPLAEELERARHETSLGAPWRGALREAAVRAGAPELRRLAGVLERSERLGAPVADQLRILARDVREERRVNQEERARRAPVVMLFPLVLCILPAFVIAAVVPAVLVAARGIR